MVYQVYIEREWSNLKYRSKRIKHGLDFLNYTGKWEYKHPFKKP